MIGSMFGSKQSPSKIALKTDTAPSWKVLQEQVAATATGQRLAAEAEARAQGAGPAHTDATLRLFGQPESAVRVTLYRDDAAWCPYCQKVWLLLEEKEIPFEVKKINMRSYGDKPAWFLNKVPGGLLPVMELDGQLITESLVLMQALDQAYPDQGPRMVPPEGTDERKRAQELLGLERQLFSHWCALTFQPGKGIFDANEKRLLMTLETVDKALGETSGPWFLGGDAPSLVDLQYVSHVERMVASLLFWKGLKIRGPTLPHLDAWLSAFEERPAYLATKSDYYTHCMDIPPQYGPGYSIPEAAADAASIGGGAWKLPLGPSNEPLAPLQDRGDEAARHEAAYKLVGNAKNIARFAARGAAPPGAKPFQAPLADPYAKPNEAAVAPVDACLRHVARALIEGTDAAEAAAAADVAGAEGADAVADCLAYLRDRVGVPRDMGQAAAMQLRAHLNWAIDKL